MKKKKIVRGLGGCHFRGNFWIMSDFNHFSFLFWKTSLRNCLFRELGATMVYISTDYVFDGTAAPYSHTAQPCPTNRCGLLGF